MENFHRTDCIEILSQIKHQEKLINLKRRWLMGLSTSKSKKKQFKEPKFFKYKTLLESFLREDDIFHVTIKAHIEEAFSAHNSERGSYAIQDGVQSFDASKIIRDIVSCLDALTNNGLYLIATILLGDSRKVEKTRRQKKKDIRESLVRCFSSENHDHEQNTTIMQLYKVLDDPQNFQKNTMKSMSPTYQSSHAAATEVLAGLEDFPFQTLIAMDRKLRCLKRVPQLQACERGKKQKRLINKVSKAAKKMLMDPDKEGKLQEPLAKALAVADLSLKLTTGCRNTSTTSFHQFSPEIISLQNDILKAIWILKTKVRFPELETLKLLLDPNAKISNRSLRGAIMNMLTEFLFECSDMDTIPKSLLETLSVINKDSLYQKKINKDSRSMPCGRFLKDDIEEEVESILSLSAQLKQIVWDVIPEHDLDEEYADAYGEKLEESDDDSCIEDNGDGEKMGNKDLESCMSYSVNSIERDVVIQDVKLDTENASSNEQGNKDINQLKSMGKLLASNNRQRDEVEQTSGVDPPKGSKISSNIQLRNGTFIHNKSSLNRNQYLTIQEACDETSLVAYNLIGRLLEKFAKEQNMDLDWSDSLYLRGDSSIKEHSEGEKQKSSEQDVRDYFQILKELMSSVPKWYFSYPPGKLCLSCFIRVFIYIGLLTLLLKNCEPIFNKPNH